MKTRAKQERIRHPFGPVADRRARVLVLGTMPGRASLAAGQYYAHPRNAFWEIMDDLVGAGRRLSYEKRLARLRRFGIALWDVIAECARAGSLDHAIRPGSIRPNDLSGLMGQMPKLRAIVFNGHEAARLFRRFHSAPSGLRLRVLPSTSPARANLSLSRKKRQWRVVRRWL